jgi:hypothetical protein
MSPDAGCQDSERPRVPSVARPSCGLRATLRALRRWWAEERHYRPERRYMRG